MTSTIPTHKLIYCTMQSHNIVHILPCSDIEIHLDDFSCPYNATDFSQCTSKNWGDNNCDHSEDVLLMCGM